MFYLFLRYLTRLAFKVYFSNVYMAGLRHVPENKPVLLACNHPSAFLEACLLAVFLPRPLYFLTRGDMFKGFFLKRLLKATNQIPIYRFRDGFGGLRSNQATFNTCYDKLKDGKMILIFSEAGTKLEKKLRPIQKGTAKLALGALERYPDLPLEIVPVSVNFADPRVLGSEAYFVFHEPIDLGGQAAELLREQKKTINRITGILEKKIGSGLVQIPKSERVELTEFCFSLFRNERIGNEFPFLRQSRDVLDLEMAVAKGIDEMNEEEFHSLHKKKLNYLEGLHELGLSDNDLAKRKRYGIGEFLLLPLASVFLLAGKMINFIPSKAYKRLIAPRVTNPPFEGALKLAVGFAFFGIFYFLLLIAFIIAVGAWGIFFTVLAIMTSYFAIKKGRWVNSGLQAIRMYFIPGRKLRELDNQRSELRHVVGLRSVKFEQASSTLE